MEIGKPGVESDGDVLCTGRGMNGTDSREEMNQEE